MSNVHGNIRGDSEVSRHSELLPGINDFEFIISLPNADNFPRGMFEVVNILNESSVNTEDGNINAYKFRIRIIEVEMTLLAQYTKLSISPHIPVYYPAIGVETYTSDNKLIPHAQARLYELHIMRIGRIPKYLIIVAQISRDAPATNLNYFIQHDQTAVNTPSESQIYGIHFEDNYLNTGGSITSKFPGGNTLYRSETQANKPYAIINNISITRSLDGEVLFRKTLDQTELYWITKRSTPAREKYPYDINSFNNGRASILINTTLCGLRGQLANEVGLFELNIKAQVGNYEYFPKNISLKCHCIYTNYGYHLKSNSFDYVEKHEQFV